MVMVNANDGTNDAMKTVSVRVTNEEEMGEVTLWAGRIPSRWRRRLARQSRGP